jgi:histone chaperone ASF1
MFPYTHDNLYKKLCKYFNLISSIILFICFGFSLSYFGYYYILNTCKEYVFIPDLEWKLIYVGSAEDENYDQQLESVLVGPVNVGTYRFVLQVLYFVMLYSTSIHLPGTINPACDLLCCDLVVHLNLHLSFSLQADPPDPSKIREEDIIGVTVLLLTCSYMGQEFMRVGYYVNNDYDDEQLREEPPAKVLIDRVQRNILADKPRVTKFPINFHPEPNTSAGQQQQEPQTASPENHTGNGDASKPEADQ